MHLHLEYGLVYLIVVQTTHSLNFLICLTFVTFLQDVFQARLEELLLHEGDVSVDWLHVLKHLLSVVLKLLIVDRTKN